MTKYNEEPYIKSNDCGKQNEGYKIAASRICDLLYRCFATLCLINHFNDICQDRLVSNLGCSKGETTQIVH